MWKTIQKYKLLNNSLINTYGKLVYNYLEVKSFIFLVSSFNVPTT